MSSDDPTSLVSADAVMAYISGVPAESRQFNFLLGEWDVSCARYRADGSEIIRYGGVWVGRELHDGRMFLDEFRAQLDDGTEISSMATLRTWCPESARWEMTFLVSHQPVLVSSFTGAMVGDEMHLKGEGKTLAGEPLVFRVLFHQISANGFEWENEVSLDGGKSWWRDSTISAKKN